MRALRNLLFPRASRWVGMFRLDSIKFLSVRRRKSSVMSTVAAVAVGWSCEICGSAVTRWKRYINI